MKSRAVNPQKWLNAWNINHGIEVSEGKRVLYLAGQTSNGPNGEVMHEGDLVAQFKLAWDNVVEHLAAADMKPSNLVRMTFYTTDVQGFMAAADKLSKIWGDAGAMPVTTLAGVTALFMPHVMVEIEATAVA
jgi:enamine deaminase RidA (YjgF/YER057c/UK114 family)